MILTLGFDVENLTFKKNLMFFTVSGMCLWPTVWWKKGWFQSSIKWPDPHLSHIKPAFSNFRATASQTEQNLRHPTFSWQITVDFFVAVLASSYFFWLETLILKLPWAWLKKESMPLSWFDIVGPVVFDADSLYAKWLWLEVR